MAKAKNPDLFLELQAFAQSALAETAAAHLQEGASLLVHSGGRSFLYRREGGRNRILETGENRVDAQLWIPPESMRHLLDLAALPGTGITTMGVAVFEKIFHAEEREKIHFRLETGFLGLWRKGYFSVLKAGGPEVASYFGRLGHQGLHFLKDMMRKF
jgi:hypothetical protein